MTKQQEPLKKKPPTPKTRAAKKRKTRVSFKNKVTGAFLSLVFVAGISLGLTSYFLLKNSLEDMALRELETLTEQIHKNVRTSVEDQIRVHLMTTLEQCAALAASFHRSLSREDTIRRLAPILLDDGFGRGRLFLLDSRGRALIHPEFVRGADLSDRDYVQKALEQDSGIGDFSEGNVVAYFRYAPAGFHFFASIPRSEAYRLVDMSRFRAEMLSTKIGETGYPYITDLQGNVIVHPVLEGQNVLDIRDADGRELGRKLTEIERGSHVYRWINPELGEKRPRTKVAYVRRYEEMGWALVSSGYLDEIHAPLSGALDILVVTLIVILGLLSLLVPRIVSSVVRPITDMIAALKSLSEGDLDVTLKGGGGDEIGMLDRVRQGHRGRTQRHGGPRHLRQRDPFGKLERTDHDRRRGVRHHVGILHIRSGGGRLRSRAVGQLP